MKISTHLKIVAGLLLALSWTLGRYVNPVWLWISVLIGINVLQSGISGFAPFETFFKSVSRNKRSASL